MTQQLTEARLTVDRPWAQPADDVLAHLGADAAGLSTASARERLALAGPNRLPEPVRRPAVVRFLSHFNDTLIYILLGAAVIKALMGDWVDFSVTMAVAIINAVIG